MGNSSSTGLQITPLTMAVCGALWLVLAGLGAWGLSKQAAANEKLSALVTSQTYDRKEIDAIRADVNAVQADVSEIHNRLGLVESRR